MTKKRGRPPKTSVTNSPTATSSSTGTRSETTLICLVHGKPSNSFFLATIGGHESVTGLRKLIKKESEPYLNDFAPCQLKLWVVDIPFNSPNLGDSSVNIANVLQGREFLYPNKVGDIFTTQPNENNIHIIVELPTSPSSYIKRLIDTFTETTQEFSKIIRQTKKRKVSLSSMNQTHLDELLNHLGFRRATSVITVDSTDNVFDEQFFAWDERIENQQAEDQKDLQGGVIKRGYMNYLSDNISISSTLVWYDPKSKKDLLNVNDVSLPFSISGTTNVLVMDEIFYSALDYRSGIRAGFELKKRVQDIHVCQAITELIATNILSNHAVFFVLTDLNNCWIFYWLSNDRTVVTFRAVDSSNALDIIERALHEDSISTTTTTTTIDPNFPIGSRINFRHLGNLQGEAPENVVPFFNRPKVQFEFEDDVANMKDMFDEMVGK